MSQRALGTDGRISPAEIGEPSRLRIGTSGKREV